MLSAERLAAEWLETDGLGGFASGTVAGWRTRRYHGLLTPAVAPPTGRAVLVDGFDAWIDIEGQSYPLSAQRYHPDVTHPAGHESIIDFRIDPWPTWTWSVGDGIVVEQSLFLPHETSSIVISWSLKTPRDGVRLRVRPFLSGRDSHALHHQNDDLDTGATIEQRDTEQTVRWRPYSSQPGVVSRANASYAHDPVWFRNFLLEEERARGFEATEDLWSPGQHGWSLSGGEAIWHLSAETGADAGQSDRGVESLSETVDRLRATEAARRKRFPSPLHRAADAYIVRRGSGKTIIAGYPWFTDWGRDTFISLRGLCLSGARLDDAEAILCEWAGAVDEGMLPNRFVEQGDAPEFNAVDASLWFVVAVHDFFRVSLAQKRRIRATVRRALESAILAILDGYVRGTRYGIGMDDDGLLRAGMPGVQLTWMDAKVGDWVVTPRIGKPVEIQALWINALRIGTPLSRQYAALAARAEQSFNTRFWLGNGCLADVVDPDGKSGTVDPTFRPNQLYAVGGLPFAIVDMERGRSIVDAVESSLWTPLGPRSLAPDEPGYVPYYEGGPVQRDGAYHMGTVWPFLSGPFVEAWVRVRGATPAAKSEARRRFLKPLLEHLDVEGIGHLSEIADAEHPHTPRGCPFQAWSVGEVLRLSNDVLASAETTALAPRARSITGARRR